MVFRFGKTTAVFMAVSAFLLAAAGCNSAEQSTDSNAAAAPTSKPGTMPTDPAQAAQAAKYKQMSEAQLHKAPAAH